MEGASLAFGFDLAAPLPAAPGFGNASDASAIYAGQSAQCGTDARLPLIHRRMPTQELELGIGGQVDECMTGR